jgi:hypothetical protein
MNIQWMLFCVVNWTVGNEHLLGSVHFSDKKSNYIKCQDSIRVKQLKVTICCVFLVKIEKFRSFKFGMAIGTQN